MVWIYIKAHHTSQTPNVWQIDNNKLYPITHSIMQVQLHIFISWETNETHM